MMFVATTNVFALRQQHTLIGQEGERQPGIYDHIFNSIELFFCNCTCKLRLPAVRDHFSWQKGRLKQQVLQPIMIVYIYWQVKYKGGLRHRKPGSMAAFAMCQYDGQSSYPRVPRYLTTRRVGTRVLKIITGLLQLYPTHPLEYHDSRINNALSFLGSEIRKIKSKKPIRIRFQNSKAYLNICLHVWVYQMFLFFPRHLQGQVYTMFYVKITTKNLT